MRAGELRLILPEAIAIGIRLSHASRESFGLGELLSNTWPNYPVEGNNLGKLRIRPHRCPTLECPGTGTQTLRRHRTWLRPIR